MNYSSSVLFYFLVENLGFTGFRSTQKRFEEEFLQTVKQTLNPGCVFTV